MKSELAALFRRAAQRISGKFDEFSAADRSIRGEVNGVVRSTGGGARNVDRESAALFAADSSSASASRLESAGSGRLEPLSERAAQMRAQSLHIPEGHVLTRDPVQFLPSTDGVRTINTVYRPLDRERHWREGIPHERGQLAIRGEGAYRLSEAFGMPRIPPTIIADGPLGKGLVQEFVRSTEMRTVRQYPEVQQQQMAVLDYVTGYTDGGLGNYRTALGDPRFRNGDLVGIDRDLSFPEAPDPTWGIRSHFVVEHQGQPLHPDVLAQVRAVHPDRLPELLGDFGPGMPRLSANAIEGAQRRLAEIQADGMITGRAWPGIFTSV
ncbi:hypothetical protein AB0L82_39410 [Nocardia sp. NPDC052001]|uniref:hypothetical protein n=1 Tax=Nocardia sp. NPDC052001 TaxID=3154853 RepID=UPI0034284E7E